MSDLRETVVATATQWTSLPWLAPYREQSLARVKAGQWPELRQEHWMHSPVRRLHAALATPTPSDTLTDKTDSIPALDAMRIVFVDGAFDADASTVAAMDGLTLVTFSEATADEQTRIVTHLGSCLNQADKRERHIMADLNGAMLSDGLFIQVDKNVQISRPIEVVYRTTGAATGLNNAPRLLVVLGTHAEATVIEQFVNNAAGSAVVNAVAELVIGDNATLKHYRLGVDQHAMVHVGAVHVVLKNNANLKGFILALGSHFKRTDMVVHHTGQGSHCDVTGLYLTRGEEHSDLNACIEHRTPHCFTDEVFRGILADKSKAIFNGRIHIHPQAQKTLANLSNKNLLLDQGAEIYTKPELEIYADDVRCAHGATVSQIQSDALYYLQTRGIGRKEAEIMLSYGFINELLNTISVAPLRAHLQSVLAVQFTRDSAILEHLG
jgi:Fe-S cluster assembly protein SufD